MQLRHLSGEGTELYRGVGAIVLFGVACTAIVTLTFLPALTVTVLERGKGRNPANADEQRDGSDT